MTAAHDTPTRRRSLRWELVVTLAVVLMMAVVSLSFATEVLGRRRHDADQRRQLSGHVQALASLITPELTGRGAARSGSLEPVLRANVGTLGIEAISIHRATAAEPLVTVGLSPPLAAPNADPAEPQHVAEEAGVLVVDRTLRSFGAKTEPLILRVVARPSAWTRTQDWPEILVLALGVGLVLMVIGIGLIELQVLRPLAKIRAAVGQVADGHLDAAVPEDGPAELQSLAGSFNQMTGSLRGRIAQIERQRGALVRAEQLASVGRISAGIAHEVGNPLAAVLGYVELLLDPRSEPELDASQRDILERSRTQIERIQDIVRQLLDYSRPPRQEPRSIRAVENAEALCSLLKHDARCTDVELCVVGNAADQIYADAGRLDQVLRNLIINAARAARAAPTPHRVAVFIEHDPAAAVVHIDVQDSGEGVAPHAREQLFEPFFTTAKAGEGTGLGLAISQGLAESMDGTLECRPPGARPPLDEARFPGAIFRVTLPAGQRSPDPLEIPGGSNAGRPPSSKNTTNPAPP